MRRFGVQKLFCNGNRQIKSKNVQQGADKQIKRHIPLNKEQRRCNGHEGN